MYLSSVCFLSTNPFCVNRRRSVFEKKKQKSTESGLGAGLTRYYAKFGARSTKREIRSCSVSLTGDKTSWPCASARLVQNDPPLVGRRRQQTTTATNNNPACINSPLQTSPPGWFFNLFGQPLTLTITAAVRLRVRGGRGVEITILRVLGPHHYCSRKQHAKLYMKSYLFVQNFVSSRNVGKYRKNVHG